MKLPAAPQGGTSAMIPADKSTLCSDKSPTRQSRYGDGALRGILAKTNK